MAQLPNLERLMRRAALPLALALISGVVSLAIAGARADLPVPVSVGVIEGDAISVTGPMCVEVVDGLV